MSKPLVDSLPATVEMPTMLTARQIAQHANVDPSTVYRAVADGSFPKPLTGFIGKSTRWLTADYLAYIERQKQAQHTDEPRLRGKRRHA